MKIEEFHCIMPIRNIPSVLARGILSFERAEALEGHESIAMADVQDRRDEVQVPGGLRLHQYANLYFHARNPMMYKRKDQAGSLCVLRISTTVRHEDGVVFADQNAASPYVRFLRPDQARLLDLKAIYAEDWTHEDQIQYFRQKSRKCAEILVPHCVPVEFLIGAYVSGVITRDHLRNLGFDRDIKIDSDLFFQ